MCKLDISVSIPLAIFCVALGGVTPCVSSTFSDDFTGGIDPASWNVNSNQVLFSIDDTNGDVRVNKPIGGSFSFQTLNLDSVCEVRGDFDVSVEFQNASINQIVGSPGNQVQLNAIFGGQLFSVVRSDEAALGGDNIHVFLAPPVVGAGTQPSIAAAGTFRIRRTGTTVTGFLDNLAIHSGNFNSAGVNRLWFSLQNNGTTDATAVTFDNFSLVADEILDCIDEDGDGSTYPTDCDDSDPLINPDAVELPGNFVDENCDGSLGDVDPCLDWKSHGEYVRNVAHAVNDLVAAGILTEDQGDDLVSSAAMSKVGKKGFVPVECQ